ncbi:hypothetical protein FRC11_010877, partial [Ceratobasidium sp. 423]
YEHFVWVLLLQLQSSSAWIMGNGGKGCLFIEFPFALDTAWYKEQPCTEFRTLEHRKERTGFKHESIILRLFDGSVCRIERTGDPNTRFDALSRQGSVAYDIAQRFRLEEVGQACLWTSDVVAEVTLPCIFDLMDVLKICRAIHEGAKTRNYTLQVLNCCFFSLAIQTENGLEKIADIDQSPTRVLERLYSVLSPCNARSECKNAFMQKIKFEFQHQITHESQLGNHSTVNLDLDKLIEEWIRVVFADVIRNSVDTITLSSNSDSDQPVATACLKHPLLEIVTERLSLADPTTLTHFPYTSQSLYSGTVDHVAHDSQKWESAS